MPETSIVIRCYNEERHIGRLLSGILQQGGLDVEIIVVDSGSTDATLSVAARYPVKILSVHPKDFSFGLSLNTGCQAASHELIVIASAHVSLERRLRLLLYTDAAIGVARTLISPCCAARFAEIGDTALSIIVRQILL